MIPPKEKFSEFLSNKKEIYWSDGGIKNNRVTHATILLTWFFYTPYGSNNFIELGCGNGYVSFFISKFFNIEGYGIDIQKEVEDSFNENAIKNGVGDKLKFLNIRVEEAKENFKQGSFDIAVFNPPHYLQSSGKEYSDEIRLKTRSGKENFVEEYSNALKYLLKNRGYFFSIISPQILDQWIITLENKNLTVKTLRFVYGKKDSNARLVLIKGIKNTKKGFLSVEPPVFL